MMMTQRVPTCLKLCEGLQFGAVDFVRAGGWIGSRMHCDAFKASVMLPTGYGTALLKAQA